MITNKQFNTELARILEQLSAIELLALIPEIYPDLAEYFNNEIINSIGERENDA